MAARKHRSQKVASRAPVALRTLVVATALIVALYAFGNQENSLATFMSSLMPWSPGAGQKTGIGTITGSSVGATSGSVSLRNGHARYLALEAAKKKADGDPISDGDTVYIKVQTGRYIGEMDGTSRKEWVKARGTKKDADHALTIEKPGGGPVASGDVIHLVMPLSVTNGTKVHLDCLGSAVRARHYDPRGQWQRITIIKYDGGPIFSGDQIFLRGHQSEYMDANPLEKAADGEVKCRWRDEGEWQSMTIEK